MSTTWTEKQGQYLAFIYYYSKINGRAPAESDIEIYFRVAAPTIHQMVLKLEEKGLISRIPGQASLKTFFSFSTPKPKSKTRCE